jgi:hypothetical protein
MTLINKKIALKIALSNHSALIVSDQETCIYVKKEPEKSLKRC